MARIVAIDWGSRRCGLAWTDPMQIVATGIGEMNQNDLLNWLRTSVPKENVTEIVIGFPSRFDGSDTDASDGARTFGEKVRGLFPVIPVHFQDERNTSKNAVEEMVKAGVPKMKRRSKSLIDKVSATLILQEFMLGK